MKPRHFALSVIALSCLAGFSVAQDEDPNLDRGKGDHPRHETEATATKDFYVGDDGSKNHPVGDHSDPPQPKETPSPTPSE
ncbi:hypothetical protein AX279_00170 [Pseudomonas sp. J237]|nr:hypothetical protein AX279_00170 [Pseudomonas sp. J237]